MGVAAGGAAGLWVGGYAAAGRGLGAHKGRNCRGQWSVVRGWRDGEAPRAGIGEADGEGAHKGRPYRGFAREGRGGGDAWGKGARAVLASLNGGWFLCGGGLGAHKGRNCSGQRVAGRGGAAGWGYGGAMGRAPTRGAPTGGLRNVGGMHGANRSTHSYDNRTRVGRRSKVQKEAQK